MHIITLYFRKLKYQTKLLVGPIHLGKPLEPTNQEAAAIPTLHHPSCLTVLCTTTNSDCCGEIIHVDCRSMQPKKFAKKKFNQVEAELGLIDSIIVGRYLGFDMILYTCNTNIICGFSFATLKMSFKTFLGYINSHEKSLDFN